jgi:co-chaperonin GroES (HSP10)
MKKLLKIFLWILLFPFMLTYWGWKTKKKPVMVIGAVLSLIVVVGSFSGQESIDSASATENPPIESQAAQESTVDHEGEATLDNEPEDPETEVAEVEVPEVQTPQEDSESSTSGNTTEDTSETTSEAVEENPSMEGNPEATIPESPQASIFEGYRLIEVDGGDLSGHREANVVVNIGFGDREYWAFTNEYGQLVKVIADRVILQDENNEPVTSQGRYYPDEAKVPGTEASDLDEGHVIADSLGGVANAYNITPQNSTLNRHGDQAYMEKVIRDAGGCTDLVAVITYPDTKTQIPSHYSFTYTLMGNVINDEFDNVNPDEVNAATDEGVANAGSSDEGATDVIVPPSSASSSVVITSLDKKAEYIVIKNTGNQAISISGWRIRSVRGDQNFTFPEHVLGVNASVKVGDSAKNADVDFHWLDGRGTWNNSDSDPAELYNSDGELVDRFED